MIPDQHRLQSDLEVLATFRDPSRAGFTRRSFTEWYEKGQRWIVEKMKACGLEVRMDAVGNVIGRRAGRKNIPAIMLGSHIDTVDGGGRFDGMVGVLGGIEVARCLEESKIFLDHPLEVVSFFAEEPTDFGVSAIGSRAMAGALDDHLIQQKDPTGKDLAAALRQTGHDPGLLDLVRRNPDDLSVYLELHIEQGPHLERMGKPVGVVSAITGFRRHRFIWSGRADHSGTMPMGLRTDALAGACESVLAVESRCKVEDEVPLVGTVGKISVRPNSINVVPDRVEFIADVRSPSIERLKEICEKNADEARTIAIRRGLAMEASEITAEAPVEIPYAIRREAASVMEELDLEPVELVSMAGHDANQIARIAPVGMIFIRSKNGRSHCPEEESAIEDVNLGVSVLFHLVRRLDQKM